MSSSNGSSDGKKSTDEDSTKNGGMESKYEPMLDSDSDDDQGVDIYDILEDDIVQEREEEIKYKKSWRYLIYRVVKYMFILLMFAFTCFTIMYLFR
jgi:hypothetical protein